MKTLAEKLKFYRLESGLSLNALAKHAEVSKNYLNMIELGKKRNVGIETLTRIAFALGVKIENLVT